MSTSHKQTTAFIQNFANRVYTAEHSGATLSDSSATAGGKGDGSSVLQCVEGNVQAETSNPKKVTFSYRFTLEKSPADMGNAKQAANDTDAFLKKHYTMRSSGERTNGSEAGGYVALGHLNGDFFVWSRDMQTIHSIPMRDLHHRSILTSIVGHAYCKTHYMHRATNNAQIVDYFRLGNDVRDNCVAAGKFEPDNVRGPGVWLNEHGDLVVNSKMVYVPSTGAELPRAGATKYVYPFGRDLAISPETPAASLEEMASLREFLRTFKLKRDDTDQRLIVGWLMQAYLVAALPWRPHMFIHAPAASGKSTLKTVLSRLLGRAGETFSNQGAAGLRQALQDKSVAILLDEAWAHFRFHELLEYLRLASDGAFMAKGTEKHKAVLFRIKTSAALFGIALPAMGRADASRFVDIAMDARVEGSPIHWLFPTSGNEQATAQLGLKMFSRSLKFWKNFIGAHALIADAFPARIGRSPATFAPLLAGVWIAENDAPMLDAAMAKRFVESFDLAENIERQNETTYEDDLLGVIFSTPVTVVLEGRTAMMSIYELARIAVDPQDPRSVDAAKTLETYGLRFEPELDCNGKRVEGTFALRIYGACILLRKIVERADLGGVNLTTLLRKIPSARHNRSARAKFSGTARNYVEIPYSFDGDL